MTDSESSADETPTTVYRVLVKNAWGQRRTVTVAGPDEQSAFDRAKAWANAVVSGFVDAKPGADAPEIDEWAENPADPGSWRAEGDTEDWLIRIDETAVKTSAPDREVPA